MEETSGHFHKPFREEVIMKVSEAVNCFRDYHAVNSQKKYAAEP